MTQYFLDLTIHLTPSTIIVDQYDKSCHNFVPWSSCHPHNTKKNIPYALALRSRTLCDLETDQKSRMEATAGHLRLLGYPNSIIHDAIDKAKARDQSELRQERIENTDKKDILPFVHTFNPKNPQIFPRILKALDILNESPRMKQIMDAATVVPSKRQPPNLKSILTKSNFSTQEKKGGVMKCGKNCANCPYMIEGDEIQMEKGETFRVQENLSCRSKNVIYVMFCAGCNAMYIGETGQPFNKRMNTHRLHINRATYRNLVVSNHIFNCPGTQNLTIKFRTCPFFKMPLNCSRIEREAKEAFFQKKFMPTLHPGTLTNDGDDDDDDDDEDNDTD